MTGSPAVTTMTAGTLANHTAGGWQHHGRGGTHTMSRRDLTWRHLRLREATFARGQAVGRQENPRSGPRLPPVSARGAYRLRPGMAVQEPLGTGAPADTGEPPETGASPWPAVPNGTAPSRQTGPGASVRDEPDTIPFRRGTVPAGLHDTAPTGLEAIGLAPPKETALPGPVETAPGLPGDTAISGPGPDRGPGALPVTEPPASEPGQPAGSGQRAGPHKSAGPHKPPQLRQGRHRRAPERQASYREVFAVREFRGLWSAQVLSYAGDQFAQVAIAILVYHRTGSPLLTALAYALTYLPPIAGGPLLSGLADLFPRRRVMIACDVVRAVLVGVMAIPRVPFGGLCALLFLTVLLSAPFSSARSALLPDVLDGDKFVLGSAVGNMTYQGSQILGFVAGAAVVALLNPYRTLGIDALSFCLSAVILAGWVKRRPSPRREAGHRPSLWAVSRDGVAVVFGSPVLRTLLLFGWLAGFYIVPEGLAAPYAHSLGGSTLTVGLLMAAMPLGTMIGAFTFGRLVTPSGRIRIMGWLAMASCAPLIGSAFSPSLWVVLALWAVAGAGGAYQLAAAAAFVQNLTPENRGRAFGLAQSGLLAVQGLGILAGGAAAQAVGAPMAVGLAGLVGFTAAATLAMSWTHRRAAVIAAMRAHSSPPGSQTSPEPESPPEPQGPPGTRNSRHPQGQPEPQNLPGVPARSPGRS
jgi:MFS family permease